MPALANVMFVEGSILDEVELKRVFFEGPDLVFHLAALFANQNSIDHPETDLLVNGLGTLKLLQYSHLAGVKRFIYASSGLLDLWQQRPPAPHRRIYVPAPQFPLSDHQDAGGTLLQLFPAPLRSAGGQGPVFQFLWARGGARASTAMSSPTSSTGPCRGEPLPITGTGEETRDFTYVGDIVDGLLRAGYFEAAVGQEFNLASGAETRIIDLAEMINGQVGNTGRHHFTERRKWDTKPRLLASVDRAKSLIGYEPNTPFEEGLKKAIAWFRDNWDRIAAAARFGPGMSSAVQQPGVQRIGLVNQISRAT